MSVTLKEKEVLSLVALGLTTKEIASKLSISHHTVETHRKNLLRKCGAKNSAELVLKTITMIAL
jgi:DNA-binding CsgD family transcriptional regulator